MPPLTRRQAADVRQLAAYRLEHGLTVPALAAEMEDAGLPVLKRALHLIVTGRLKTRPRDTTLYKIAQFVARLPADARTA
jgi:hypothetical protein